VLSFNFSGSGQFDFSSHSNVLATARAQSIRNAEETRLWQPTCFPNSVTCSRNCSKIWRCFGKVGIALLGFCDRSGKNRKESYQNQPYQNVRFRLLFCVHARRALRSRLVVRTRGRYIMPERMSWTPKSKENRQ